MAGVCAGAAIAASRAGFVLPIKWVIWIPTAWYLLAAALGFVGLMRLGRRPKAIEKHSMKTNETFEMVSEDGDEWMERRVALGRTDNIIRIRLPSDADRFAKALPYADTLIRNLITFEQTLQTFLEDELKKHPHDSEEIRSLKLDSVSFFNKKPASAEVVFAECQSGRIWACLYRDGAFSNFSFDD
jgi:hypothetical protein